MHSSPLPCGIFSGPRSSSVTPLAHMDAPKRLQIEGQGSHRSHHWFGVTTLQRGTDLDRFGGFVVLEYNNYSHLLTYTLSHQHFPHFSIGGLLNDSRLPTSTSSYLVASEDLTAAAEATHPPANTTSPQAECQTARGLAVCAEWNGRAVGTCYRVEEMDAVAQQTVRAFGGECARQWACAAVATCYFSDNPRHWCAFTPDMVCRAAFRACGMKHVAVPDIPPALRPTPEHAPRPADFVDPDTAEGERMRTVAGASLRLVFSDEFGRPGRRFGNGRDGKWEAAEGPLDAHATSAESYTPAAVTTRNGRAVLRISRNTTYSLANQAYAYRSALLQTWNKFCFTGGYVEANVRLPGSPYLPGVWSAFWLMGNLGRAGAASTTGPGVWPWAYDTCDDVARSSQAGHSAGAQAYSACDDWSAAYDWPSFRGRGVPEVDVFAVLTQAPGGEAANLSTALHLNPRLPPGTTFGAGPSGDCTASGCSGVTVNHESRHNTRLERAECRAMLRGPGNDYDCVAADSRVYETHFAEFHRYGVWVEPGEYVAWFLDDVLLFNVTQVGACLPRPAPSMVWGVAGSGGDVCLPGLGAFHFRIVG